MKEYLNNLCDIETTLVLYGDQQNFNSLLRIGL